MDEEVVLNKKEQELIVDIYDSIIDIAYTSYIEISKDFNIKCSSDLLKQIDKELYIKCGGKR